MHKGRGASSAGARLARHRASQAVTVDEATTRRRGRDAAPIEEPATWTIRPHATCGTKARPRTEGRAARSRGSPRRRRATRGLSTAETRSARRVSTPETCGTRAVRTSARKCARTSRRTGCVGFDVTAAPNCRRGDHPDEKQREAIHCVSPNTGYTLSTPRIRRTLSPLFAATRIRMNLSRL